MTAGMMSKERFSTFDMSSKKNWDISSNTLVYMYDIHRIPSILRNRCWLYKYLYSLNCCYGVSIIFQLIVYYIVERIRMELLGTITNYDWRGYGLLHKYNKQYDFLQELELLLPYRLQESHYFSIYRSICWMLVFGKHTNVY